MTTIPHRQAVVLIGLLLTLAVVFVLSLIMAPTKDIATTDWFSLRSLGDAGRDYATVFAGVAGWVAGAAVGCVGAVKLPLGRLAY